MKFLDLTTTTETDNLLKSILGRYYFSSETNRNFTNHPDTCIELFLKASCGSNCSYCYLHNHRKELYPMNLEKDDIILKNLGAFLDFYVENKLNNSFEIFSGRIFDTQFGLDVFDLIYSKFQNTIYKPMDIVIPDDMQFLLNETQTEKIEFWMDKFEEIGIHIHFSASVDGRIIDYERFGDKVDLFYDTLKDFGERRQCGFHPMVSAHAIDKWIENFEWYCKFLDDKIEKLMLLVVRNDDWDSDKIKHYLRYLNKVFDYIYNKYKNKKTFFKELIGYESGPTFGIFSMTKGIELKPVARCYRLPCALQNTLAVRMADLAIIPCHRTGYDKFVSGYFNINEGEINELKSKNVSVLTMLNNITLENLVKCSNCPINRICMGPCLGANYESSHELLYAPDTVCFLFKCVYIFLLYKINSVGGISLLLKEGKDVKDMLQPLFDYHSMLINQPQDNYVMDLVNDILEELNIPKGDEEEFNNELEEDEGKKET